MIVLHVGDSVVVKPGILDPDFGTDISGWQGRIKEIDDGNTVERIVNGEYFIEWECGADLPIDTIKAKWKPLNEEHSEAIRSDS